MQQGRVKRERGAAGFGITAQRLKTLGVIDKVIPEPLGGAQIHLREPRDAGKHTCDDHPPLERRVLGIFSASSVWHLRA